MRGVHALEVIRAHAIDPPRDGVLLEPLPSNPRARKLDRVNWDLVYNGAADLARSRADATNHTVAEQLADFDLEPAEPPLNPQNTLHRNRWVAAGKSIEQGYFRRASRYLSRAATLDLVNLEAIDPYDFAIHFTAQSLTINAIVGYGDNGKDRPTLAVYLSPVDVGFTMSYYGLQGRWAGEIRETIIEHVRTPSRIDEALGGRVL